METRVKQLQDQADKILEYLEDLEQRGNLASNKQARTIYNEKKKLLEEIIDELDSLQIEEKRNLNIMQKIEKRTTNEFESILRGEERSLQTTAEGASIIPENVHESIILKMEETSKVFGKARKLNSVSGSLRVNRENATSVGGFVGEGSEILEGGISFEHVDLKQKRVGAALSLSNQLINDSAVNIEEYAGNLLARRTAKAIEKSMLVGLGGEEFNGVIHDVEVATVEAPKDFDIDNLLDLYLAIHPEFIQGASFVMQRDFFNVVAKKKDNNGHYFLQNGIINGKLTYTLFGMEVDVTDALPATTPVIFGNIEEAISIMIKQQSGLQRIAADTTQALRGSQLFVYDLYADAAVVNPQAIAKMTVAAV